MSIKVRFFASLAESVGSRESSVDEKDGLTVESVWCQITGQGEIPEDILCAVNHSYCEHDQSLSAGDEVAFFPPVTGG